MKPVTAALVAWVIIAVGVVWWLAVAYVRQRRALRELQRLWQEGNAAQMAQRLDENWRAYERALGGDYRSWQFLGRRAGVVGERDGVGMWATEVARDDARKKYDWLAPMFAGKMPRRRSTKNLRRTTGGWSGAVAS